MMAQNNANQTRYTEPQLTDSYKEMNVFPTPQPRFLIVKLFFRETLQNPGALRYKKKQIIITCQAANNF